MDRDMCKKNRCFAIRLFEIHTDPGHRGFTAIISVYQVHKHEARYTGANQIYYRILSAILQGMHAESAPTRNLWCASMYDPREICKW
jgi:hypothetical protein